MKDEISIIILAAGKGKRMKSDIPKVLHKLCGKSIIEIVLNVVKDFNFKNIVTVVGHGKEMVKKSLENYNLIFVEQTLQRGTGDAVLCCKEKFNDLSDNILILCGDMPLIKKETLNEFLTVYFEKQLDIAVLSTCFKEPYGYGRIVRDKGKFVKIVEEKDADNIEKKIKEVNSGIYCVKKNILFNLLKKIDNNNNQLEYYLTDIVEKGVNENLKVDAILTGDEEELVGINSREQLAYAENILLGRIIKDLQLNGVTFIKPETTYLHFDVSIGKDTVIYPNNQILGNTKIGDNCLIGGFNTIVNSTIDNDVQIKGYCYIDTAFVNSSSQIGPFSHLRPATYIGEECRVGNFVEIKKSELKKGVKASHLSYIGDAVIEDEVNVGAGTITCNYDGFNKYKTEIGKGVFIGSDTQLVAPVKIGDYSLIAAGSTVTTDVPENSLVHSRVKQVNIKNKGMKNRKK